MDIRKFPDENSVNSAISADEPLLAIIAFDGKTAVVSHIDEAVEHHILLMKAGLRDTDIDKFFRIGFPALYGLPCGNKYSQALPQTP